ncbi:repeat-companion domain protein [Isosphaera pallida ATCC 43644]|uniref:Repeat-companion domain protein n=1 Tax=Isosphaera pallida (strain ATCC 43644 / DSM 9630 / IS1B) TaxID=575540 RepID=E8R6H1_ISOPI|nr:TIGR02996 domain-containing protein [Isosphaera pallida]ADV62882.1 repeat-companion domain protein [Isosphaera pallida ATCC 43644]
MLADENDHTPFLKAILTTDPPWDALRIYADWLEERGEVDRAEFFRLQAEIEEIDDEEDPWVEALTARRYRLYRRHRAEWLAALPTLPGIRWEGSAGFSFRSAHLWLDDESWPGQDSLDRLFAHVPVRDLWIERIQPEPARLLARSQWLDVVRRLEIVLNPNNHLDAVETLVQSCRYQRLEALTLPLGRGGWSRQATQRFAVLDAPRLNRLRLIGGVFEAGPGQALRDLLPAELPAKLRGLGLFLQTIDRTTLEWLDDSATWPHLERLDLFRNALESDDWRTLAHSKLIRRLRGVMLANNNLGVRQAQIVAQAGPFPEVEHLDVSFNRMSDVALGILLQAFQPRSLDLSENQLTLHGYGDGMLGPDSTWGRAFWETPRLTSIDLRSNRLDRRSAALLAQWPALTRLISLKLADNPRLGDAGAIALAKAPPCPELALLDLSNCDIRGPGARALAESDLLESLELLKLIGNPIPWHDRVALTERLGDRVVFTLVPRALPMTSGEGP